MITTTYFCRVCQDPFNGASCKGGRQFCERHRQHAGKSVRSLLLHIADQEHKLELRDADNGALTKRVAELEEQLSNLGDDYGALLQESNTFEVERKALQSQLTWTPVSAGLPTEPGLYEFTDGTPDDTKTYTREHSRWYGHGVSFDQTPLAKARWAYTHYRRIELPEATGRD